LHKWKQYNLGGSYNDWIEYKFAIKAAEKEYRNAKQVFETKVAAEVESNVKSYGHIRLKTLLKDVVGPPRGVNGTMVSGKKNVKSAK
jgi:hypothetical protein